MVTDGAKCPTGAKSRRARNPEGREIPKGAKSRRARNPEGRGIPKGAESRGARTARSVERCKRQHRYDPIRRASLRETVDCAVRVSRRTLSRRMGLRAVWDFAPLAPNGISRRRIIGAFLSSASVSGLATPIRRPSRTDRALFTKFWNDEAATTAQRACRACPKAPTIGPTRSRGPLSEIAWQIVCEEKMLIDALESGKAEWNPPPPPKTMKEVVDAYEQQRAMIAERWNGIPRWPLRWNARVLRQSAADLADGVELSVRHRAPSRPDHDVPPADGLHGAADLRAERRRALSDGDGYSGRRSRVSSPSGFRISPSATR